MVVSAQKISAYVWPRFGTGKRKGIRMSILGAHPRDTRTAALKLNPARTFRDSDHKSQPHHANAQMQLEVQCYIVL